MSDDPVFTMHRGGKISVTPSVDVSDAQSLAMAYTPGVARVCTAIADDPGLAAEYTWVGSTVAVVTDGTAVLGLGDIGPAAAMPVMEGKSLLFKRFAGIDAVPIALNTTDTDQIVATVAALAPSFGGINLEDISAPRCFEVEDRLRELLDIPVFHDDQHGTAIVTLAALRSAARVAGREFGQLRAVVAGAGASGVAVTRILLAAGLGDIAVSDSKGLIHQGRDGLNPVKQALAAQTNKAGLTGSTESALRGADVFIGLSSSQVAEEAIASMAHRAIVFALSNPDPEVHPDVAARHALVVATGRGDFPNQINNSLAFPGIFRGALDVRATTITEHMKHAAADAITALVGDAASPGYVIPGQFDDRVAPAVAAAVAAAARADGVAGR
jgi:malate dehydrogenase (oxaloacetate-decarboxylating)